MENNSASLSLTRKLLSFNTINPPGKECDCAEYLGNLLEEGGFQVRFYEFDYQRTSLIAHSHREGSVNKAAICFTGHIDTVPLGATRWSRDPFKGEIDHDKIYARGSTDMKGGAAAVVVAALHLTKMPRGTAGKGDAAGVFPRLCGSYQPSCRCTRDRGRKT